MSIKNLKVTFGFLEIEALKSAHNAQTGNYMKLKFHFNPISFEQSFKTTIDELSMVFVGACGHPHKKTAYYNLDILASYRLLHFIANGNKGVVLKFPLCGSLGQPNDDIIIFRKEDALDFANLSFGSRSSTYG